MRQWGWLPGILGAFSAQATLIEFDLTGLGGGRWQSDDSLIHDGTGSAGGFLIEFPSGLNANPNERGQRNWKNYTLTQIPAESNHYLSGPCRCLQITSKQSHGA